MHLRRSVRLIPVLILVFASALTAASPAPPAAHPSELDQLQDAFFHEIALQAILSSPALLAYAHSAGLEPARLVDQAPALVERQITLATTVIDRVVADLREGRSTLLHATVSFVRQSPFPQVGAFESFARQLRERLAFETAQGGLQERVARIVKQDENTLRDFLAQGKKRAGRDPTKEIVRLMKTNPRAFWSSFTDVAMKPNVDQPSTQANAHKLDINRATVAQLREIRGIDLKIARKIVRTRSRKGPFNAISELASIKGIGPATLARLENCAFAGDFKRSKRDWTVIVYTATNNNLEGTGLDELRLLEKVGSSDRVNIVNQVARIGPDKLKDKDDDDTSDGNWASVRRYYVTRNDDSADGEPITSPVVAKLGRTNMGDPKTLADFCRWAIEYFPARRYWLVISNHGGGPMLGVASDDDTGEMLETWRLGDALRQVNEFLRTKSGDGAARIDLLSFDTCLMGSWEVVYELRDVVRFIVASPKIAFGTYAFDRMLADLEARPGMQAKSLGLVTLRRELEAKTRGKDEGHAIDLTIALYDPAKLAPAAKALDELGQALSRVLPAESAAFTRAATAAHPMDKDSAELVDLDGFCELVGTEFKDPAVRDAAQNVRKSLAVTPTTTPPTEVSDLSVEVEGPSGIVWRVVGKEMPPEAMWPSGSSFYGFGMVKSPALGPDKDGSYRVVFPAFDPVKLGVRSIECQKVGPRGALGEVQRASGFNPDDAGLLMRRFGPESPLVAYGFTGAWRRARGVSIVAPCIADERLWLWMEKRYPTLRWAKETSWGELFRKAGEVGRAHRARAGK